MIKILSKTLTTEPKYKIIYNMDKVYISLNGSKILNDRGFTLNMED